MLQLYQKQRFSARSHFKNNTPEEISREVREVRISPPENSIETEDGVVARAFILTPSGQEFLDTYWKMKGFLDVFGEAEARPH
jgi:hypothetical protein